MTIKQCVVLNQELKQKALEIAKKKGLSLNALIRLAISEYIEKEER